MNGETCIISELGKVITKRLFEMDKTQTWLAGQCKVTKNHICMVVTGKCRASFMVLWGISKALDLDFDELVILNRKKSA